MKKRLLGGVATAGFAAAFGIVASAQSAPPQPTQPPAQTTPAQPQTRTPDQSDRQVTIVACVQREADYRRAHNLGRGGAVGTGAGVANEFVLVNASVGGGATGTTAGATTGTGTTTGSTTGSTTGTSGAGDSGHAYEVSGANESQLEQYVGKRVEIVAKVKPAETGPTGTTGGATAGTPPAGVDLTSPDLKLKEVEIVSVKEAAGSCPTNPMK